MVNIAPQRTISSSYQDPTDLIWQQALTELHITLLRSADAYASWDGAGTLTLASAEFLDADDCLAQMIFHELCHLLVSGEKARQQADWGLDNTSPRDLVYEYATQRLQAALAQAYGLRGFMAVTTMFRPYYDVLPLDPLADCDDPAQPLALAGFQLARSAPYRQVLHKALQATAALADAIHPHAPPRSLWSAYQPRHPSGFRVSPHAEPTCDACAWAVGHRGNTLQCRKTKIGNQPRSYSLADDAPAASPLRISVQQHGCHYWEPVLTDTSCFSCGACCHKGFDVVEVSPHETFAKRHPELIDVRSAERCVVPRPGGHCIALTGDGSAAQPYLCQHYKERPRSCRQFPVGGDACLQARQRCGIGGSTG
jgi:hypothetical protein